MTQNNRHQQNPNWTFYGQQQHRSQSQTRAQSGYRAPSPRETLERELRSLERELSSLDQEIDALWEKGQLLQQAQRAHQQQIPLAIAQVALSTIGVRYLPPVARTWYYRHQEYLRADEHLRHHALSLQTRRKSLEAQIEHLHIQLEMLQYRP